MTAVDEGRRVYDNVRKFIFYIFVHATPEVVPFLVFALSGGAIPLPLTVLADPRHRPRHRDAARPRPRPRTGRARTHGPATSPAGEGRDPAGMLVRAWVFLGLLSAALVLGGFFFVLVRAGWHLGDAIGAGTALHHAYLQATTMTFLGIVACQIGTAFAARTERASLRSIGVFTNTLLLWGIAFELAVAAAVVTLPPLQAAFHTAVPEPISARAAPPLPVHHLGRRRAATLAGARSSRVSVSGPRSLVGERRGWTMVMTRARRGRVDRPL